LFVWLCLFVTLVSPGGGVDEVVDVTDEDILPRRIRRDFGPMQSALQSAWWQPAAGRDKDKQRLGPAPGKRVDEASGRHENP
jgi:hypothetical protein